MPVYPCDATVHACGEPVGVRCGGMFRRWGGELSGSRTRRRRALSRARFYRATCAPQCLRSVCPAPELRAMSGGEAGLAFQYLDSLVYGARARSKRERLCHQPPSLPVLSSPPWSQAGFPPARALSLCASCGQSLSYAAGGHNPAFFPAGRTHRDPCGAWEDDPEARFDVAFFEAATSGYAQGFGMPLVRKNAPGTCVPPGTLRSNSPCAFSSMWSTMPILVLTLRAIRTVVPTM